MTPEYQHHLEGSAMEPGMVVAAPCAAKAEVKSD
jgi:hypothetical protein